MPIIIVVRRGQTNTKGEMNMLPEILRYNINTFGRWTLIKASEMRDAGRSIEAIADNLGLLEDVVENCIQAGAVLRRIAAEQKRFEDAIIEPF